jgi:hypothetical protein
MVCNDAAARERFGTMDGRVGRQVTDVNVNVTMQTVPAASGRIHHIDINAYTASARHG